jgi:predicted ferric reductase
MGMIMDSKRPEKGLWWLIATSIGLPIFLYASGDFPKRTLLKESISIVVILSFCLMLAQFFLARTTRMMLSGYSMARVISIHKVLGYSLITVLLVHPLLLVVPRYFESGIDPMDAFIAIITNVRSLGVGLGICAWFLMLILGITSLLRKKIPLTYKRWRLLHGLLAVPVLILASWHCLNLGRHVTSIFIVYVVVFAVSGIFVLCKTYIMLSKVEQGAVR